MATSFQFTYIFHSWKCLFFPICHWMLRFYHRNLPMYISKVEKKLLSWNHKMVFLVSASTHVKLHNVYLVYKKFGRLSGKVMVCPKRNTALQRFPSLLRGVGGWLEDNYINSALANELWEAMQIGMLNRKYTVKNVWFPRFPWEYCGCSTTRKPTHLFRTKCASLDSV